MKYKTSELADALLDAAVAKAEGMTKRSLRVGVPPKFLARDAPFECNATEDGEHGDEFQPSDRWDHGGPIIERERIDIEYESDMGIHDWTATHPGGEGRMPKNGHGPTTLVAAMRAFIRARLGDEVDL